MAEIVLTDDGLVVARVFPGVKQSVDDALANLAAAVEARGGLRRPILVDIAAAEPLEPEVRRCYAGEILSSFTALAMLVEASPFGRMIGNIYLQIAGPRIPAKLFADETRALVWLRTHVR